MKSHFAAVAALALAASFAITDSSAHAQSAAFYNPNRAAQRPMTWPPTGRIARYQATPSQTPPAASNTPEALPEPAQESAPVEHDIPHAPGTDYPYSQGEIIDGYSFDGGYGDYANGYHADGYCADGSCGDGYYGDVGCCDTCGTSGSDCGCGSGYFSGMFGCCPPGKLYVRAEYLYVRPTFSEAVSFLDQNDDVQNLGVDTFHELEFERESSYRFGGGYRLCGCGEEIRFLFTRMSSEASDIAPFGAFTPYEATAPPGGQTFIDGEVDLRSYDLEYAKTIPIGGSCCECGDVCGDPCGCGDACGGGCPKWDITWSGGVRFADVDTSRRFTAVNDQDIITTDALAIMTFEGGGPRFGMEGRRYFGQGGWLSAYLKGDVSLLIGHIDLRAERTGPGGSVPDLVNIQTMRHRQIIPVTEIEAGLSGHVTRNSALSAGYLFHAWHDLGFRDQFNFPTFLETSYDDANILGFDGFFARLEVSF